MEGSEGPGFFRVTRWVIHAMVWRERQGGTSFTFVTGGVERAVGLAKDAAGGKDVAVAGGGTLLRQVLADEQRAELVAVQGDGMGLIIHPRTAGGSEVVLHNGVVIRSRRFRARRRRPVDLCHVLQVLGQRLLRTARPCGHVRRVHRAARRSGC
jgi:hypothetical protein